MAAQYNETWYADSKDSEQKEIFHPAVWHVFLAQKLPVPINSLGEKHCSQRKSVVRYDKSRKLFSIWGGFGKELNFNLIKKFHFGTLFAQFKKTFM